MFKYQKNILTVMVALLVVVGLNLTSIYSYLLFHSLAELFSIVVGFTLFIIAWNSRDFSKGRTDYLTFIGIAYLFVSCLDLLHTLSYKGMSIFKGYDYYANQLWIGARYLESISLLAPFIYIRFKKHFRPYVIFVVYIIITSTIIASIFYFKTFPICFVIGSGQTQFKIVSEYIICLILIIDTIVLRRNKNIFNRKVYKYLLWSFIFTIASEFSFTIYISNYGFSNLVGHYFKIFSFYLIYRAIIITCITEPYETIFKELTDKENKLIRLTMTDELTGLYNRRAALEFLNKIIKTVVRKGETVTICFIDVDNLKKVNDKYGHVGGDNLLITVANLLSGGIKETDYACRIGGDEFLLILTDSTLNNSKYMVSRIRDDMEKYNSDTSDNYKVDFSYGFAEYNSVNQIAIDTLLEIADNNMYQNKMKKKKKVLEENMVELKA